MKTKVSLSNSLSVPSLKSIKTKHQQQHQQHCHRHQSHRNSKIMVSCYFVVLFINLFNLTLCNYVNENIKDSENSKVSSITATTTTTTPITTSQSLPYGNESLWQARELFEDSTGMVWSEFLEDYVLRYVHVCMYIHYNTKPKYALSPILFNSNEPMF